MATYPVQFDIPHNGLKWLEYYSSHNVYHPGWDLNKGVGNQDLGNPVLAPVKGEVEYASPEPKLTNNYNGGFGWFVILYHPGYGVWTRYAHLNKILVRQNQKVEEGDKIGEVGATGTAYAHLHWEGWKSTMYDIQRKYWRRFAYYPSGQTKAYITQHYFDPLQWVEELNKKPDWRQKEEEWVAQFVQDIPGLLSDFDSHRWIALIHRAVDNKKDK